MSFTPIDYLRHILDEAEYLIAKSQGLARKSFLHDPTLKRAFVRSSEIIGEATKQIPDDFRQRHTQLDWRAMAGMRDRLIHGYFGVDYDIVWDVAANKAPALREEILQIIEKESSV